MIKVACYQIARKRIDAWVEKMAGKTRALGLLVNMAVSDDLFDFPFGRFKREGHVVKVDAVKPGES